MIDTAAKEGFGEVFLRITGDNDDRFEGFGGNSEPGLVAQFRDVELELFHFAKQVVREIARGFVDFVDEDNGGVGSGAEFLPFEECLGGIGERIGPKNRFAKPLGAEVRQRFGGNVQPLDLSIAEMGDGVVVVE